MRHGYQFMRAESQRAEVDLGALQLAGSAAPPSLWLTAPLAHDPFLSGVTAGRYFAVTRAHGSPPVYGSDQIASSPLSQRQAADSVLAAASGITVVPARAGHLGRGCVVLAAGAAGAGTPLALSLGGVFLESLSDVPLVIGVSHFAPSQRPAYIGFLAPRATARVVIPAASANLHWRVSLTTGGRAARAAVTACRA
jgi:hypothetical protein